MGFSSNKGLLVTFLASFLITCCVGKDETISGGSVQCKILGQSGKIRLVNISNNTEGNFSVYNTNQLTFEVDAIAEVDVQGNEVGKTGAKKHALNTLASQQFLFTKVDNVSYFQGIRAINVNLTAYLSGPQATLNIMVFLFLDDGNVTFGNESFAVFKGTLKFNIKIEHWEFCDAELNNCRKGQKKETGAFIDLTLAIKSKGTPKKMSKEERDKSRKKRVCYKKKDKECPESYDMGGGSELLLTKGVLLDDNPAAMPDGFPKFITKGSKNLFIFRIPKFNNTVLIDPTANMDGVAGDSITDGGNSGRDRGEGGNDPDKSKNETITGGNVRCKILGQSGKILLVYISNNTEGNFSVYNKNQLTFEVDAITEVDAQGSVVGKSGAKKHALNSLASQEFNFSKVDNVSYYQGIKAINVNLTAYLSGPQATLNIMVFLFLDDGNVTFGNESFAVFKGTLKFNIKIEHWEFCDAERNNCGKGQLSETGAFIDLTLAIKSKGTPKKMSKEERDKSRKKRVCYKKKDKECPESYDMGGGSELLLTKGVLLDDNPAAMPDGFPKFNTKGSKNLFIFRIPKFNNTVLIDPTANMDGVAGDSITDGGNSGRDRGEGENDPDKSKNETITGGNVRCKILGQSGKILLVYISNNTEGNFSDYNKNQLTFEVDAIAEVDAQGSVVGKSGAKKHALNSLASQEFNFSKVDNVSYYQGIKAINVNLTAYLSGPQATLNIMVFLFLDDGNVTFGNESFAVFKGTLKFNIKINNWEFCDAERNNCGKGQLSETGAFIDLTLAIKSKGTPKKMSKEERDKSRKKRICYKKKDKECPESYDMGGGSELLLTKGVLLDGSESAYMPDPFPKFVTKGSKKLFVLRIPRFNNTVLIDPTANMDGVADGPITSGGEGGNGGGESNGGGGAGSNSGGDSNGGGDGDGDGDNYPDEGKNSASMLPFNIIMLVLAALLHVANLFTIL